MKSYNNRSFCSLLSAFEEFLNREIQPFEYMYQLEKRNHKRRQGPHLQASVRFASKYKLETTNYSGPGHGVHRALLRKHDTLREGN